MKRTPLKRKTPLRSTTGLKRVPFHWKPRGDSPELRKARKALKERSGGVCEFPGCHQPATDAHHIKLRSRGGSDDVANLVHLDRAHHRWCHDNPAEATRLGLMQSAWDESEKR